MGIEEIEKQINKDMAERKSPKYYTWTEADGTEYDVFDYTSSEYFLSSMYVHIIRAGEKPTETREDDLRNAYNCGICYVVKEKQVINFTHPNIATHFQDVYVFISKMSLLDIHTHIYWDMKNKYEYHETVVMNFLIWYNIQKERG